MLLFGATVAPCFSNKRFIYLGCVSNKKKKNINSIKKQATSRMTLSCCSNLTIGLLTAATIILSPAMAIEAPPPPKQQQEETLSNIPQMLSGECASPNDCKKPRIQRPKSRQAESCTIKCVTTCIQGGAGSPGEGPFNARRPLVVFKEGFRTRQYCLVECSDICNLIKDGDDGP